MSRLAERFGSASQHCQNTLRRNTCFELKLRALLLQPAAGRRYGKADAGPVIFDFTFDDASRTRLEPVSTHLTTIARGTQSSFPSVTDYTRAFNVPSLGLSLSSAAGDLRSTILS